MLVNLVQIDFGLWLTDNIIRLYAWFIDLRLKLFIDLLSSCVKDRLRLSERYRISGLFWPIQSTIGLSDFHTIVLTLAKFDVIAIVPACLHVCLSICLEHIDIELKR